MATAQPLSSLTEEQLLRIANDPGLKEIVVTALRDSAHTIATLNGDPFMNALMALPASAGARAIQEFAVGILNDHADILERLVLP